MTFDDAQKDMNYAYYGGSTGALVSGIVWCLAGYMAMASGQNASMITLFIGGMFIFPLSMVLSKLLKRPGNHSSDNPLGKLALESTVILFFGLFLAFYISTLIAEWFYPIMLLTIGVRYLVFNTLYGNRTYWLLGAVLMAAGALCLVLGASFYAGAFIGGAIEILFGLIILFQSKGLVLETA